MPCEISVPFSSGDKSEFWRDQPGKEGKLPKEGGNQSNNYKTQRVFRFPFSYKFQPSLSRALIEPRVSNSALGAETIHFWREITPNLGCVHHSFLDNQKTNKIYWD